MYHTLFLSKSNIKYSNMGNFTANASTPLYYFNIQMFEDWSTTLSIKPTLYSFCRFNIYYLLKYTIVHNQYCVSCLFNIFGTTCTLVFAFTWFFFYFLYSKSNARLTFLSQIHCHFYFAHYFCVLLWTCDLLWTNASKFCSYWSNI